MQILFTTAFIAHCIATQIVHNIGHGFEGKLPPPIAHSRWRRRTVYIFQPFSPSYRRSRRPKQMTTIEVFQSIDFLTSVKPANSMRAGWKACSEDYR